MQFVKRRAESFIIQIREHLEFVLLKKRNAESLNRNLEHICMAILGSNKINSTVNFQISFISLLINLQAAPASLN
jgi:hypothetical protein